MHQGCDSWLMVWMKGVAVKNFHLIMKIIEGAVILPDITYLFQLKKSPKFLSKYGGKSRNCFRVF